MSHCPLICLSAECWSIIQPGSQPTRFPACWSIDLPAYWAISLPAYQSSCLFIYHFLPAIYLSSCLRSVSFPAFRCIISTFWSVFLPVNLSVFLPVDLSLYQSSCLSIYRSSCLCRYQSFCLSICLPVCQSVFPLIYLCLSTWRFLSAWIDPLAWASSMLIFETNLFSLIYFNPFVS